MDIIEKVRICGHSNKCFVELKFSERSVSVKMYAHQLRIETVRSVSKTRRQDQMVQDLVFKTDQRSLCKLVGRTVTKMKV